MAKLDKCLLTDVAEKLMLDLMEKHPGASERHFIKQTSAH